jgi:Quinohemoprotein amine dehydrogenase, gamma subunit
MSDRRRRNLPEDNEMKHLKAANRKARRVEAPQPAEGKGDVVGMVQPMGCTTIFNPGWEANPWGGAHNMCSPSEADIAGCSGVCWWPAQVPDSLQNYPEWSKGCSGVNVEDWRSLAAEFPKVK